MRTLPLILLILSMYALPSCHSQSDVAATLSTEPPGPQHEKDNTPTEKEVIYMVMQLHDVPLQVHPSCEGMGTNFNDTTIGQFLSGFWAYQAAPDGETELIVNVTPGDSADGIERWTARMMIGGMMEETPYQVGISFDIRSSDREVEVGSIRCLGAG